MIGSWEHKRNLYYLFKIWTIGFLRETNGYRSNFYGVRKCSWKRWELHSITSYYIIMYYNILDSIAPETVVLQNNYKIEIQERFIFPQYSGCFFYCLFGWFGFQYSDNFCLLIRLSHLLMSNVIIHMVGLSQPLYFLCTTWLPLVGWI